MCEEIFPICFCWKCQTHSFTFIHFQMALKTVNTWLTVRHCKNEIRQLTFTIWKEAWAAVSCCSDARIQQPRGCWDGFYFHFGTLFFPCCYFSIKLSTECWCSLHSVNHSRRMLNDSSTSSQRYILMTEPPVWISTIVFTKNRSVTLKSC